AGGGHRTVMTVVAGSPPPPRGGPRASATRCAPPSPLVFRGTGRAPPGGPAWAPPSRRAAAGAAPRGAAGGGGEAGPCPRRAPRCAGERREGRSVAGPAGRAVINVYHGDTRAPVHHHGLSAAWRGSPRTSSAPPLLPTSLIGEAITYATNQCPARGVCSTDRR